MTPLGNKNLAIMANLSSSSILMALEGLPEDLRKKFFPTVIK
jgi:hypothetical protein